MRVRLDRSVRTILVCRVWVYDATGKQSRQLLGAVDTGASGMMISFEVARSLGYSLLGAPTEAVLTGNGVIHAPKIVLGRVDVGRASATELEAICHDLPEESLIDALVGLSFLTRFDVRFDFDAWEMELTPRD